MTTHGLKVTKLEEYDYDIGNIAKMYDGKGMPLSYFMIAEKS